MSWKQILGHDRIIHQFANAWQTGRLGHAYLFAGPPGIGKQSLARELANTLLCERKTSSFASCGECAGCHLFTANTHPDYLYATKPADKNEFPIKQVRELIDQFGMKSLRGGYKIAVLDDAETLSTEAANAFLKTLEEPPPKAMLILLSRVDSEQMLPTIRSRCQVVRFSALLPADVREILSRHGVDDPILRDRLARLGGGSPGQAIELNDPDLWAFRNILVGLLKSEQIDSLEFTKQWQQFIDEAGKESGPKRKRLALVLKLFVNLLQDAVRIVHGVPPLVADSELHEILSKFAERVGLDKIDRWTERAIAADDQNERYVQIDLILEAFADFLGR
ncbi:DNA polymerase III subunit delta' [Zavarzinella formosa]|uniref:DNA polymerase III subunit delta' n=1 Tax=Zavarzinella formosa TaxID=360055 RepID=UPI0002D613DE|nr:DNA polymerase III subunit delta' [Zavarzinella formosa]